MPSASRDCCRRPPARSAGFTLVETVVAIALVGIAAAGVASVLTVGTRAQADPLWQARTTALAEAWFEEILAQRYDEATAQGGVPACAPAAAPCSTADAFDDGEVRAEFDDVDDFDGLDLLPPTGPDGGALPGYERYRLQVAVDYADADARAAWGLDDASDAKRVTLTITPPGLDAVQFSAVRANF